MTGRFFSRLLFAFLLVLLIGAAILDVSLRRIVDGALRQQMERTLESEARLLGAQIGEDGAPSAARLASAAAKAARAQVTVYARGEPLTEMSPGFPVDAASGPFDPRQTATSAQVPAGEGAAARAVRHGTLFVAVRTGLYVVRFAYPLTAIEARLWSVRRNILLATLISLLFAALIAALLARRMAGRLRRMVTFAERIAAGDLSVRLEEQDQDELAVLARALDATASRLERAFASLESSRRELAAVLDSMQEGVIAVAANGQVSWSNAIMPRLARQPVRPGRMLVESVRDPEVLDCVSRALRERETARGRARSIAPGRTFEVSAAPMPGGGAVVVLHDVTEIERAETMRRDFVANVSHELRTPLTSVSGYAEAILEGQEPIGDATRDFLQIILRNATRMHRLTEELLALARVESGDLKLALQPLRAASLVEDAVDSLRPLVEDAGLELEQGEMAREWVMADPDALQQVFGNLVENAVKYGAPGRRVRVGAIPRADAIEFYVQDFGPGIGSEHQPRIFERFYRVDKARSRESGGTGLGLSIARHIVQAHGGSIRVESELGAGATFFFSLPLAAGRPPQMARAAPQGAAVASRS